jgi:hypothetical protein
MMTAEMALGDKAARRFAALVAGTVVNGRGFDVVAPNGVRIEVRTRTAGTDSETPRLTLNTAKMAGCHLVVVTHCDPAGNVVRSRIVRTRGLAPLYDRYQQKNGNAHIPWREIERLPGVDITRKMAAA